MISTTHLLAKLNIRHHDNQGIAICNVADADTGVDLVYRIVAESTDRKTVLYLSGGSTPKNLYQRIAQAEEIIPAAVGMVDERYGSKWHAKSNELMMQEAGLLRYLSMRAIPFYPILRHCEEERRSNPTQEIATLPSVTRNDTCREQTADRYDQKVRELNATFQQSIGILGIGNDGHTSGIPAGSSKFKVQSSKLFDSYDFVTEYNDESGTYGERVTMTFLGLSMLDLLIVMVFGSDKKEAIEAMFEEGSEEIIPARFYTRPEIAKKTLFITDQSV